MVGLQHLNKEFTDRIIEHKKYIYEVYFSWGDFANGRNNQVENDAYTSWELQKLQVEALEKISAAGIPVNLLFNGNCYGKYSQSKAFFNKIGNTIEYIKENYGLQSVTTTSPLIAKFIKDNFEDIEVRASVNMSIGTIEGMDYISDYFDGYYMKRELNRDFEAIKKLRAWCDIHNKKLYMLANSGCLNNCSAHTFHDNLVSHESEISQMDNAYEFGGMCHEYLSKPEHYEALIKNTNFVRPEDIHKYESYFEAVKLATRTNKHPSNILKSYISEKYVGNILELLEPAHSIYPYVLENGESLRIIKIDEDIAIYEEVE